MTDNKGHRCGGCPRRWTGLAEAHCPTCHRHFGSVSAFDKHRVAGSCADPAALRGPKTGKPLLVPVQRASGEVWMAPSGGEWWTDDAA